MNAITIVSIRDQISKELQKVPNAFFDIVMVEGGCLVECISEIHCEPLVADLLTNLHKSLPNSESAFPFQIYWYLRKDDAFDKVVNFRSSHRDIDSENLQVAPVFETTARIKMIAADALHYRVFRPFNFEIKPSSSELSSQTIFDRYRVIEINGTAYDLLKFDIVKNQDGSLSYFATI